MTPILVETKAECVEALAAARSAEVPLIAFTPVGFAGYAGVLFAKEMWQQACALHPDQAATLWVDCGEDAALVQEGLQVGLTHLVYHGDTENFVKLSEIAAQYDAQIRRDRPALFSHTPRACG